MTTISLSDLESQYVWDNINSLIIITLHDKVNIFPLDSPTLQWEGACQTVVRYCYSSDHKRSAREWRIERQNFTIRNVVYLQGPRSVAAWQHSAATWLLCPEGLPRLSCAAVWQHSAVTWLLRLQALQRPSAVAVWQHSAPSIWQHSVPPLWKHPAPSAGWHPPICEHAVCKHALLYNY
jgi:hypothetical protein